MSAAWPYQEAGRIRVPEDGRPVVFETGYGPSGLPHIGTFTEVLRTSMVRRAFEELNPGVPTRLIVFSDDMDAMRRVPDNVPNRAMMEEHVGRSLSRVPDPFGTHESFAAHNNAMLRDFLDRFGFDYEFRSATDSYQSGFFDETLLAILRNYDAVRDIILPTLGEDRRATYCPFMPILPDGRVLDRGYLAHNAEGGEVIFAVDGREVIFPVTGGHCKLQWKVDWAMRWVAFGVHYEMAGKDLTDSVHLSGRIVRALGHRPPAGMIYEMFLDDEGRKISKSTGNGITIDEWLRYGPQESLAYFLYREPRRAKNLHARLIPRAIEDYWRARRDYQNQTPEQRQANPVHHMHSGQVPKGDLQVGFGMLLNLVGILGTDNPEVVWGYLVSNYLGGDHTDVEVRRLIPFAIAYHRDVVAAELVRREATPDERVALDALADRLLASGTNDAEALQSVVYEVGKEHGYADRLRDWFRVNYEVVFGSSEGPRLGGFIAVYGVEPFVALLCNLNLVDETEANG
jgi:lysyl-tRNA synthetase, class I